MKKHKNNFKHRLMNIIISLFFKKYVTFMFKRAFSVKPSRVNDIINRVNTKDFALRRKHSFFDKMRGLKHRQRNARIRKIMNKVDNNEYNVNDIPYELRVQLLTFKVDSFNEFSKHEANT